MQLARKGLSVWLFSSLTCIALIHVIDALSALVLGNSIRLLQLYPLISEKLQAIAPITYFWISAAACLIFWGITCAIAFENPVEIFLNQVLSDAKRQGDVENQLVEDKGEILDAMCETLETSNETLADVNDVVHNVRTEVREIQPLKESVEKIRTELASLKKEIKKIDEKAMFANLCPACGKPLLPEFNICPYCGENLKLHQPPIIKLKDYK
jgi:rRNA maturation endonuclease Nob1